MSTRSGGGNAAANQSQTLLNQPADMYIDPKPDPVTHRRGSIYIADGYGNHRVVVFDAEGDYLRQWGGVAGTVNNPTTDSLGLFASGDGGHPHCVVIGNDDPTASLPGEYLIHDPTKAFLDYTEKYSGTGNNEFVVPAPVSDEMSNRIRELAVRAFRAVDGSGLGRVDFFLKNDGGLLVNEINTMPGLTDASGFPKMWAGSGKPFSEVIDELVELAFQRHSDRSANKTSI